MVSVAVPRIVRANTNPVAQSSHARRHAIYTMRPTHLTFRSCRHHHPQPVQCATFSSSHGRSDQHILYIVYIMRAAYNARLDLVVAVAAVLKHMQPLFASSVLCAVPKRIYFTSSLLHLVALFAIECMFVQRTLLVVARIYAERKGDGSSMQSTMYIYIVYTHIMVCGSETYLLFNAPKLHSYLNIYIYMCRRRGDE